MNEETTATTLEVQTIPERPQELGELLSLMKKMEEASAARTAMAKKQLNLTRLGTVFLAVMAATVMVFVGVLMPRITTTLDYADGALENLSEVAQDLKESDIQSLLANVDEMVRQGRVSLSAAESALKSIESIDIAGLNQAIADLRRIVSPLSAIFGKK